MSVVGFSKILQKNSVAVDKASHVQKIQKGRDVTSLTSEAREAMCSDMKSVKREAKRMEYMLSLDHSFWENTKFIDEYEINFNSTTEDAVVASNYFTIPLIFNETTGYKQVNNLWDAFVVNKISITFYSTESDNQAPIICKYLMPPCSDEVPTSFIDKATKEAYLL